MGLDAADVELRQLLAEEPTGPVVHYEPPAETRKCIEAKSREVIDLKATTPAEEPVDDREVAPESIDDDFDSDDGLG